MEEFFKECNSIDIIEVYELLLNRYNDINFILNLELSEGLLFIFKAKEKFLEEKLWARWLIDYSNMTEETFISFEEYKNKLLGARINTFDNIDKNKLLEKAQNIKNKIKSKEVISDGI